MSPGIIRNIHRGCTALAICGLLLLCAEYTLAQEQPPDDWYPRSKFAGQFDWIQMRSGEWVKGRIIAMYDERLEFDSDEFDNLTLRWHKIKQVRTSQVVNVRLLQNRSAVGKLVMVGDEVKVYGQEVQSFDKGDVLTITANPRRSTSGTWSCLPGSLYSRETPIFEKSPCWQT